MNAVDGIDTKEEFSSLSVFGRNQCGNRRRKSCDGFLFIRAF